VFVEPGDESGIVDSDGTLLAYGMADLGTTISKPDNLRVLGHIAAGRPPRVFRRHSSTVVVYLGECVIDQRQPVERWIESDAMYSFHDGGLVRKTPAMIPLLRLLPNGEIVEFSKALYSERPKPSAVASLALTSRSPSSALGEPARRVRRAGTDAPLSGGQRPDEAALRRLVAAARANPDASAALADLDAAQTLATMVQQQTRQRGLEALRAVVDDPRSTEHAIQKVVERNPWLFGGRFAGRTLRRRITASDILDLTLVRHDGSLHAVELKQACIPRLLYTNHGVPTVGREVWDAFTQAMNYLTVLDEQQLSIERLLGADCRRASMTVVIGHRRFVEGPYSDQDVSRALRTFNAEHARIQVITYDELIRFAEHDLQASS